VIYLVYTTLITGLLQLDLALSIPSLLQLLFWLVRLLLCGCPTILLLLLLMVVDPAPAHGAPPPSITHGVGSDDGLHDKNTLLLSLLVLIAAMLAPLLPACPAALPATKPLAVEIAPTGVPAPLLPALLLPHLLQSRLLCMMAPCVSPVATSTAAAAPVYEADCRA